jgi:hypothetical protein
LQEYHISLSCEDDCSFLYQTTVTPDTYERLVCYERLATPFSRFPAFVHELISAVSAGSRCQRHQADDDVNERYVPSFHKLVRIFQYLTGNRSNAPQLNVARWQNPEYIVLGIITSYVLNPFIVNVPQRHFVTIAHQKFWGYGDFYSMLFTIKEIMSIQCGCFQLLGEHFVAQWCIVRDRIPGHRSPGRLRCSVQTSQSRISFSVRCRV